MGGANENHRLAGCPVHRRLVNLLRMRHEWDDRTVGPGTTAAAADIAKAVTDFTSSTTPGAGGAQNPVRAKKRLQVFTASSYDNLRSDISRGYGEYLVSLATLAGVPSAQFPEFQSLMQDSYCTMFDDVIPAAESTRQIVDIAWAAGYGHTP